MTTFLTLLTGGGLAIVGGLLSGLLTNWLGAKRDERKYNHEQAMVRETRIQSRLEQAYIELHTCLSHYRDWANSVQPLWGPVSEPILLPRQELWRIEALVTAYGSEEVRRLLKEWEEQARKLENADQLIRWVKESKNPSKEIDKEAQDEHRAVPRYKEAMYKADAAIREQVRRELRGEA
jgi:hypothetical protein